jgi:hypothetical protein
VCSQLIYFHDSLHKYVTREALAYVLTLRFSEFGSCWVKVARKLNGDVIGFVQYIVCASIYFPTTTLTDWSSTLGTLLMP